MQRDHAAEDKKQDAGQCKQEEVAGTRMRGGGWWWWTSLVQEVLEEHHSRRMTVRKQNGYLEIEKMAWGTWWRGEMHATHCLPWSIYLCSAALWYRVCLVFSVCLLVLCSPPQPLPSVLLPSSFFLLLLLAGSLKLGRKQFEPFRTHLEKNSRTAFLVFVGSPGFGSALMGQFKLPASLVSNGRKKELQPPRSPRQTPNDKAAVNHDEGGVGTRNSNEFHQ